MEYYPWMFLTIMIVTALAAAVKKGPEKEEAGMTPYYFQVRRRRLYLWGFLILLFFCFGLQAILMLIFNNPLFLEMHRALLPFFGVLYAVCALGLLNYYRRSIRVEGAVITFSSLFKGKRHYSFQNIVGVRIKSAPNSEKMIIYLDSGKKYSAHSSCVGYTFLDMRLKMENIPYDIR